MKKSILLAGLIACIVFMSCKKDSVSSTSSNPSTELQSLVSFTADGINYTVNGSLADSAYHGSIFTKNAPVIGDVTDVQNDSIGLDYYLQVENSDLLSLTLTIPTRILTVATYNLTNTGNYNGSFFTIPNTVGTPGSNGIFSTTVTIQSIHDGPYADGTFSGTVQPEGDTPSYVTITNGTFKNVKILY
jgi:hypothetical protein